VRAIGLDVHRDFCEVAIAEAGNVRSAGRIATRPDVLEAFAQSLTTDDRVALEVTGNAWEIARIIEPHVRRVIVVSPSDTGIRQARAKTDRLDARTLAKLLAAGSLDSVWMPDERTRVMRRRLARRDQLVSARTRAKNEIHAILIRRLKGRPDVSDLFGKGPDVAGRARAAHRGTRDPRQRPAADRFPRRRGRGRRSRDRARCAQLAPRTSADVRPRREPDRGHHLPGGGREHRALP
jgi:transposase